MSGVSAVSGVLAAPGGAVAGAQPVQRTGVLDEVVVILFIGGPGQRTVPRQMWSGIRDSIDPPILAVATLLTVFAVALFGAINWLRSRSP